MTKGTQSGLDRARAMDAFVEKVGKNKFAILADDFRAAMIDTSRIGFPLEVLDPEIRRRSDDACRAILPKLHRAHRIVLDADFTRLAARLSLQPPVDLARFLDLARLPFDHLWLEWPQAERASATVGVNYRKDTDIPQRVGVLISPIDDQTYQLICVQGYTHSVGPSPIGMVFSFTKDLTEERQGRLGTLRDPSGMITGFRYEGDDKVAAREIDECPIGYHYMVKVRRDQPDQAALGDAIAAHAWMALVPPFGPLHRETIEHARVAGKTDVVDRQSTWLGLNTRENNGLWRWLICVFGLLNTGGGEFIMSEPKSQRRQVFRGGTLPAYEYRVLKLKRPTMPEIVTKKLPSTSSLGKRYHTVSGSWHHQRLATAECRRHPKICPIAMWHKVIDEETGEIVGSDQRECALCHRLRWWVPEHPRGNKALGVVDKGYEITASPGARPGVRTEEVVDKLPPGVRLKTIHRIEATQHHGDQSDEHPGRRRNPPSE